MYVLGPFLSTFYPPISHFSVITCRRVDRSHFAVEASQRPRETPRVADMEIEQAKNEHLIYLVLTYSFDFRNVFWFQTSLGCTNITNLYLIWPKSAPPIAKNKRPQRYLQHCDPTFGQKLPWQLSSDQNPYDILLYWWVDRDPCNGSLWSL